MITAKGLGRGLVPLDNPGPPPMNTPKCSTEAFTYTRRQMSVRCPYTAPVENVFLRIFPYYRKTFFFFIEILKRVTY